MPVNTPKIYLLFSFVIPLTSLVTIPAVLANSYTLKHGFCTDYSKQNKSILSSDFYYEVAKDYDYCMKNADKLIQKREDRERAEKDYRERKIRIRNQELENIKKMPLEDLFN